MDWTSDFLCTRSTCVGRSSLAMARLLVGPRAAWSGWRGARDEACRDIRCPWVHRLRAAHGLRVRLLNHLEQRVAGLSIGLGRRGQRQARPGCVDAERLPSDFPVYPGSRLTVAGQITANGQTTWGLQWETLDSVDAVQAFYMKRLNEGDWTLTYNGSSNGSFSAIFSRKSNRKDAGILTVELESDVTHIALAFGVNG